MVYHGKLNDGIPQVNKLPWYYHTQKTMWCTTVYTIVQYTMVQPMVHHGTLDHGTPRGE